MCIEPLDLYRNILVRICASLHHYNMLNITLHFYIPHTNPCLTLTLRNSSMPASLCFQLPLSSCCMQGAGRTAAALSSHTSTWWRNTAESRPAPPGGLNPSAQCHRLPTHRELSLQRFGLRCLLGLPSVGPFPTGRRFGFLRSPACLGRAIHQNKK